MGYPPAAHHKRWHQEFVTGESNEHLIGCAGPNTAVLAPRGPLDVDTPVLTPAGYRPLKEIGVGDLVYAVDGTPTRVLATVDYSETECYRVHLSDGTSVVCDDSHRWDVRRMGTDEKGEWRTVTLQEIRCFATDGTQGNWRTGVSRTVRMAEPGEKPWLDGRGYPRYQVPVADAVKFPAQELPLDPYLLGVLIGDGALTTGSPRFHKDDPDLVDRVRASLPEGYVLTPCGKKKGNWLIASEEGKRLKRGFGQTGNKVRLALEQLGLWDCRSEQKFIPEAYLRGSIAQRLALLQGLLDTDGTCAKSTGRGGVSYGSSSRRLMDDIIELGRSLGAVVHEIKPYQSSYRKADGTKVMCRMAYRCSFRFPEGLMPFHCEAKGRLYQGPASGRANGGRVRSIVDIEPVGLRPVRCITVEHKDELFLVNSCLVVKNSAKSTVLGLFCAWQIGIHAQAKQMLRILYLGYSLSIASSRSHTIKAILRSKAYREVFPMVRISKTRKSDILWSIDHDFAGIDYVGDDPFTMCAQGLSGSIASRRSQLIILDDVIKSSEAIENPEIRKRLVTNWQEVVRPTMYDGGRAIALGTRYLSNDIFDTTFNEKNKWKVVTQSAIVTGDDGIEKSYWPEFVSLTHLRQLRFEDPVSFSYQFQNLPVSRSEIDFPDDWLKPATLLESYDSLAVGIDLSSGVKERNDYTVMVLGGVVDGRIEVIDFRRMRVMGNMEKLHALCEMLADWGVLLEGEGDQEHVWFPTDVPCDIYIEGISYQQSLKGDAETELWEKMGLRNLNLRAIKGLRGDKLTRFRGTFGLFQTSRVVWNRWINWEPFWREMKNVGSGDHDDCVDAFVLMVRALIGNSSLRPAWGEWNLDD